MMEAAGRRSFDVLVFWDLSRLSRGGVSETLRVLGQLKAWGIAYRSLQEGYIDALKRGFLDGRAGFSYSTLMAFYEYMIVCKTRELEQKTSSKDPKAFLPG